MSYSMAIITGLLIIVFIIIINAYKNLNPEASVDSWMTPKLRLNKLSQTPLSDFKEVKKWFRTTFKFEITLEFQNVPNRTTFQNNERFVLA